MKRSFYSLFRKRGVILFFLFVGVMLGLLAILLRMQVFGYEAYQQKVLDQVTVGSSLKAERGNIYDRNGNLLATSITTYRIYISPVDIRAYEKKNGAGAAAEIAKGLARILSKDEETIYKKTQRYYLLDETIQKNVEEALADEVLQFAKDRGYTAMIHREATTKRYYPYTSLAAQAIGFTGGDGQGLFGLELYYDQYLAGTDGKYVTAKDAGGRDMPNGYTGYLPAEDGLDMHTTLDLYIQTQLERVLQDAADDAGAANRVCGVVMEVDTGAILGMATLPSYDLNSPYTLSEAALSQLAAYEEGSEEYRAKKNELLYEMWNNKTITETYEPGSTFKIITSAMGIEEGVVTPADPFHCTGAFRVGGVIIRCHKRTGHGSLNFSTGLQQSCNPVFMQVAARLGAERFYQYVQTFGYLRKTGIDLPSETGSIFHQLAGIHEVELATAAFGQRFNVSVMQQITAVAAVANGGTLVTPHLLSSFTNEEGATVLAYATKERGQTVSEATCQTVSTILEAGVSGGGGAKNAYVCGYQIAAKTGTSEKLNGKRIGSCVAYAPANDPKIAVIIMVDEPTSGMVYGSVVAAPYVSDLLANILPYLGYAPSYTAEDEKTAPVIVESYIGLTRAEAAKRIRALGLTPTFADENGGDTITAQVPSAGTAVLREGGRVILYTGGSPRETVQVPSLLGKTAQEANVLLLDAGLNIEIIGARNGLLESTARVVAVSHAAGEYVSPGSVITVTFRHLDQDSSE